MKISEKMSEGNYSVFICTFYFSYNSALIYWMSYSTVNCQGQIYKTKIQIYYIDDCFIYHDRGYTWYIRTLIG